MSEIDVSVYAEKDTIEIYGIAYPLAMFRSDPSITLMPRKPTLAMLQAAQNAGAVSLWEAKRIWDAMLAVWEESHHA
jgi:hypothetical protein